MEISLTIISLKDNNMLILKVQHASKKKKPGGDPRNTESLMIPATGE
jgi:hypothetical protein